MFTDTVYKKIFFVNFAKGLEDSMRRNAVRSIGVEACLFEQKELEQLYAVFKVTQLHYGGISLTNKIFSGCF